jgi:hypothetical protein
MHTENLPIPPVQETVRLLLLRWVIQDLQQTIVETLRIRDNVRAGEDRGGAKGEANLSAKLAK